MGAVCPRALCHETNVGGIVGITKQLSKDTAGGRQDMQTANTIAGPGAQEQALRNRFEQLGLSQADAIQLAMDMAKQAPSTSLGPLDPATQALLDQSYQGAEANLRRFGGIMGQDLAGTRGLNPSDTPVSEAVLREVLPAYANIQSARAQQGLGLAQFQKTFGEGARQFNLQSLLNGAQSMPASGFGLMQSLQNDRFKTGATRVSGFYDTWNQPSMQNRVNKETESFRNVGQGIGGMMGG